MGLNDRFGFIDILMLSLFKIKLFKLLVYITELLCFEMPQLFFNNRCGGEPLPSIGAGVKKG